MFDDFHGEYTDLGDPCIGDTDGTSFYGQFTCIMRIHGIDQYIAMADRWKPTERQKKFGIKYLKLVEKAMSGGKHADITTPDYSPRPAGKLSGKPIIHTENTSIARYVWLPIEWDGEKPLVRWHDEWTIAEQI